MIHPHVLATQSCIYYVRPDDPLRYLDSIVTNLGVPSYGLTLRGTSAAVKFHVSEYNLVHVFIDRLNDTSICSL